MPTRIAGEEWNSVGLHELMQCLYEKKWLIVSVGIVTLILSLIVAFSRTPQFTASVLLQVHHKQENSLGAVTSEPGQPAKDNLTDEPVSVQMSLIRSRFILEPLIQSLGPDAIKGKHYYLKSISRNALSESRLIEKLRSHLTVKDLTGLAENFPNKPAILQLSLTGSDPEEVMRLVNKIAVITQRKDAERKRAEASKTLNFLTQQLHLVQAELKKSEADLNHYRSVSNKIDVKLQTQHLLTRLSDVDKKLEATRLKRLELSQQYTSLHPSLIEVTEKQAELKKQRENIFAQVKTMTETDQVSDDLVRDVKVKKDLYMILLNRIHAQQVITAGIVSDIGILSYATFSDTLLPLRLTTIGIAGLLIGLVLGSFAVLVWRMGMTEACK